MVGRASSQAARVASSSGGHGPDDDTWVVDESGGVCCEHCSLGSACGRGNDEIVRAPNASSLSGVYEQVAVGASGVEVVRLDGDRCQERFDERFACRSVMIVGQLDTHQ
jgi:hypothetical protein